MSPRRNRRFPVISRLTWAWTTLAVVSASVCAYAAVWGAHALRPQKIALPVSEIEVLARAELPAPATRSVLQLPERLEPRIPGPELQLAEPSFSEGQDELEYDESATGDADEDALDIVITVDGAPARSAGLPALGPKLASLTSLKRSGPIPEPDPALLQATPLGKVPKVGPDGRRALRVYAAPFEGEKDSPKVGLVVGGLGLNPEITARAIEELPPYITLAFAPYAKDLERWTKEARAAGHEIMVELPMEGHAGGVETLGPAALLTSRTEEENLQRLDWLLSRFGGYIGATNYMGGKFSASRSDLSSVLARLEALGLSYIDDTGAAANVAGHSSSLMSVNRMIATKGAMSEPDDVARDLAVLASIAAKRGSALGKTYAFDVTLDAIIEWARDLEAQDVTLAPASAILQERADRG